MHVLLISTLAAIQRGRSDDIHNYDIHINKLLHKYTETLTVGYIISVEFKKRIRLKRVNQSCKKEYVEPKQFLFICLQIYYLP